MDTPRGGLIGLALARISSRYISNPPRGVEWSAAERSTASLYLSLYLVLLPLLCAPRSYFC
jgi:hypothetical protein